MLKERIRELCKLKGTSIPKLELELGLSSGSISKWGKSSPKAENLVKVANYFNVSVDYLLGKDEPDLVDQAIRYIQIKDIANMNDDNKNRTATEQKVIDLYNSMPPEMQKAALAQLEALAALNKKE